MTKINKVLKRKKMKNSGVTVMAIVLIFLLLGCAAMPKSTSLFHHVPLLPRGTVDVKAGFDAFDDKRPQKEKKMMKNIPDLAEQVSSVVCRDFRDAELFDSIQMGYTKDEVDIIVRGEIRSFFWKSGYSATTFIPYVNLIHLIGIPCGSNKGGVELYVELVNAKTGERIAAYNESSNSKKAYSVYQSMSHRVSGGEETGGAFRIVVDLLRKDILVDKEKIENHVR